MTQMHKGFLFIGVFLYAAFFGPEDLRGNSRRR